MKRYFFLILSITFFVFTMTPAHAIVTTGDVDFYCPERLFGDYIGYFETHDNIHICPVNKFLKGGSGTTPPDPTPDCDTTKDSDFDFINDCSDLCPDEPENYNFIEDTDGCPDESEPIITSLAHLFQAFGNTITTTPNSLVSNQQMLIQWNNGDAIIIENVVVSESAFRFTFESLPVVKAGTGLPLSQNNILYEVEIPRTCSDIVNNECVQLLRYEIPTTVFGVINGTSVSDDTFIIIDLSDDDFDPNLLLLFLLLLIPLIGILFRRRKKKKHQRSFFARDSLT